MSKTRVAVYGSLRIGMGNNRCLDGAEFIGRTTLHGMGMVSLGGYPACDFCDEHIAQTDEDTSIVIEVFDVDTVGGLPRLDMLEGCDPREPEGEDNYYSRREVVTPFGLAWVYFIKGTLEENRPFIEHGDWVKYRGEMG